MLKFTLYGAPFPHSTSLHGREQTHLLSLHSEIAQPKYHTHTHSRLRTMIVKLPKTREPFHYSLKT